MAEIVVDELGLQGDGTALLDGNRIYVAGGVPGDRLRVDVAGERARIAEILDPSPCRRPPSCRHFGTCGGCTLQHIETNLYREWKIRRISAYLSRRGIESPEIGPVTTSPPESRRRARFAARRLGNGEVILGFNERRSQRIVDLAGCDILLPIITKRLPDIRDMLAALLTPGSTCDVQITTAGSGLDLWLICKDDPSAEVRLRLARMADDIDLARLSIGPDAEPISVRRPVMVDLSGTQVELPPGAFLQATAEGEASLCRVVRDVIEESHSKSAADLFCGIGTFTFAISPLVNVFAVEDDAPSLDAIRHAAGNAQNLHKITCERRDLERRPLSEQELQNFDAVVFDPPRAGARAQAAALSRSSVPLIVAVSCNPATFSRDARILLDGGYRLEIVWPVDQFLWSPHLELVAIFRR